jgi:hypothetical protein
MIQQMDRVVRISAVLAGLIWWHVVRFLVADAGNF